MTIAYIAVGSNLGDRAQAIEKAAWLLSEIGIPIRRRAPVYETEPVGGPPQGKYLNTVWEVKTALPASELLYTLLRIEKVLGRERYEKNAPRTLDLDLLFYGSEQIKAENLEVPHPRLHQRLFVLQPLHDLAPDFRHPVSGKTIHQLWKEASAGKSALATIESHS